ncbi:MAG: DUF131 domain-containing protein [Candidatus Aenigmarchaeota archaeon]|nr:DUF131 domain-containing protein [Candidatus Aenigmarchaeota archaeon]
MRIVYQDLIILGVVLLFIAIILIIVGFVLSAEKEGGKIEFGFGGFIGPIPFGWASDPKMLKWIILFSLVGVIIFFVSIFMMSKV